MLHVPADLFRAGILHTPGNPFREETALEHFSDGGLLVDGGKIQAVGDYAQVAAGHPQARTHDLRPGFLLPGFIDTHTHFPQVRVMGGLGYTLLDWLDQCALPEEARMADTLYAATIAAEFVRGLLSHGTTTALVFGAHFPAATAALFESGLASGLRLISGLVLSDRRLRPELHRAPNAAYRESSELIRQYHGRGRLSYAVTPRFALSCSEPLLEVCQALLAEHSGLIFQTHLNENTSEVREVAAAFPWAGDYLSVYERFRLVRRASVFAHNVHPTERELSALAAADAGVAYCPSSNAALGSGLFPMRGHLRSSVRFALGTDIGAGTGFGLLKEGLQAYLLQRLDPEGLPLTPAHLLYLATRAGAEVLGMESQTGDFSVGKAADFVHVQAGRDSPLWNVLHRAESADEILAAVFTLGSSEAVREVRIGGARVYPPSEVR